VKLALRYLRAHAAEYGIDGSRVAAVGGSSGGNYAAMMCVLSGRDELADRRDYADQSEDVQAGVIWFPPTDFPLMDAQLRESGAGVPDHSQPDSPESLYLGGPLLELDPEYVQQANPVTYVHQGMPPTFIQHGRKDRLVPWQQSELLVDRIEEVCGTGRVGYEILEHADHGDPLFDADENIAKCLAWLDELLK
jgi:acetyl esterase/lipase